MGRTTPLAMSGEESLMQSPLPNNAAVGLELSVCSRGRRQGSDGVERCVLEAVVFSFFFCHVCLFRLPTDGVSP